MHFEISQNVPLPSLPRLKYFPDGPMVLPDSGKGGLGNGSKVGLLLGMVIQNVLGLVVTTR